MTNAAVGLEPHEPTENCMSVHCHIHHVDEPDEGAYIFCFECGHVYRTARDLRRAYRREYRRTTVRWGKEPLWRRVWTLMTVRAKRIDFCQECTHSF